jgi:cytochrome c-type biogenesis protein CcmF
MKSAQTDFVRVETRSIRESLMHDGQTDYVLDVLVEENGRQFELSPILEFFHKREMLHAQPAIHSNMARDIQVVMTALPAGSDFKATLKVYRFPLMGWIWAGGALMALGGFFQLAGCLKRQA